MEQEQEQFLGDFFRAVTDRPLEFKDHQRSPYYVPLYEDPHLAPHDPVGLLARAIQWTPGESVQLLSGFRGCGKSTELRRLQAHLRDKGYKVVLCDIEDYIGLSQPVDISDFLMAVAGAFGDGLLEEGYLEGDPAKEGYWARLTHFLKRTEVQLSDVSLGGELGGSAKLDDQNQATAKLSAAVKLSLKTDPSFRQKLQKAMAGHLGTLVSDVRSYIEGCVKKVKARHGQEAEVVLLVDSMEHIRGTSTNAAAVQSSVETLFASHSDKLHLPYLHVVYTVPPYLKVLYPNIGSLYAPGGVQVLPSLKLRERKGPQAFEAGLDLFARVIAARGDWRRLLGPDRKLLDGLSYYSGGQLRDFLRLFAEILRRAYRVPVPEETVTAAVRQIQSEFLPLAEADVLWLRRIAETQEPALPDQARLPDLARFLDTHLVLCYRNGEEWYDVHPLVADVVKEQAEAIAKRAAAAKAAGPATPPAGVTT